VASNQPAYAPTPVAEPTGQWSFGEPDADLVRDDDPSGTAPRTQPRLPRQRTGLPGLGGAAVGSTVLGIAAMAAVGAGGVAAAAQAPAAAPITVADTPLAPEPLPAAAPRPVTATATLTAPAPAAHPAPAVAAPTAPAPVAPAEAEPAAEPAAPAPAAPVTSPGDALCSRIIAQVTQQREAAEQAKREAAAAQAAKEAAARKVREQAAAAKAEAEAKAKAAAEAAAQAEAERLAQLAASYVKPLASYTLTTAFGESGNMWATHTGQDFAAPTGTPVYAVHTGTVTSAGWAGSYGYRVVLRLDDGTELWYCHLSTMVATSGKVTTGDTIGRVGATGNTPDPHLHLEVRPDGGAPVDPVPWLYGHDVAV
jgi:murein DD-endopeptidase MepM/ murein hydrolase activator NlpD